MDSCPPESEIVSFTPLSTLNILIHPLYLKHPPKSPKDFAHLKQIVSSFNTARNRLARNILERMTPQKNDEITYISPPIVNSKYEIELQKEIAVANKYAEYAQWPELVEELKQKTEFRSHVIVGKNIVPNKIDGKVDPSALLNDLNLQGYCIGRNTRIVVGGETLNDCIEGGIWTILDLPAVDRIYIDKHCILTSDYYHAGEETPEREELMRTALINKLQGNKLLIKEDENYIIISRTDIS